MIRYYEFAVRLEAPLDPDYADLVFVPRGDVSAVACATDEHTMRMAVILAPFSEFAGITGRGCDPPDASMGRKLSAEHCVAVPFEVLG